MTENPLIELAEIINTQNLKIELLQENLAQRTLALEDVGWAKVSGYEQNDDGLSLDALKTISEKLRELAATNPWHTRGAQLRHAYVFGRGMSFQNANQPRVQKVLTDSHNRSTLFSVEAYEANNLALFTDGNLWVTRNEVTNHFVNIPLNQITAFSSDPDDPNSIWYFRREWSSNGEQKVMWYPVARFKRTNKIAKTIDVGGKREPVSKDTVIYWKSSKRQTGWALGIPDSLAAMVWTLAYSGYLQDNVRLLHALSQFAWTFTQQNANAVDKSAATIKAPNGVGGTAVMNDGSALASVGVPSAQVNLNNGQPLIAAVAASFGVPTIALLSSPGATGGSYGAATTLDEPTLKGFEAVQDSWRLFYEEILFDLGAKKAEVQFPSIESDPPYRQITGYAALVELGILWPDEVREAVLELMDAPKLHNNLPPKPEPATSTAGTVVSKQGNSGKLGATTNPGGDTNHQADSENK